MLDHDLSLMKPDYQGGSLVNLMRSLGDSLGVTSNGYAPLTLLPAARLQKAQRVVLLVIDGLGDALLEQLRAARSPESWQSMVTEFKPLSEADVKRIYGEALPPGLALIG